MHRSKLPLTVWFWAAHLMATHSNGMSALRFAAQLGITYKTAWLLTQKLRRSMVDPGREPLEGVVEVDQTEIPFRADNTFFEPGKSGKIIIAGAVEVIDRAVNQAKPRRKKAKYLDRSGRVRLAAIWDNSAASIETFMRANVKRGTTLLIDGHRSYLGLTDYRHDPRTVGRMAVHVPLPWIHRVFSLMKRWGLGTYHRLRRKHVDAYLNEFVFRYISAFSDTFRSRSCSPGAMTRRSTGTSSAATIPAKARRPSGARRAAARRRTACRRMAQDRRETRNPTPLRVRRCRNFRYGVPWDNKISHGSNDLFTDICIFDVRPFQHGGEHWADHSDI
jgi:hypothetical protein